MLVSVKRMFTSTLTVRPHVGVIAIQGLDLNCCANVVVMLSVRSCRPIGRMITVMTLTLCACVWVVGDVGTFTHAFVCSAFCTTGRVVKSIFDLCICMCMCVCALDSS